MITIGGTDNKSGNATLTEVGKLFQFRCFLGWFAVQSSERSLPFWKTNNEAQHHAESLRLLRFTAEITVQSHEVIDSLLEQNPGLSLKFIRNL
jgi:hypothetical protein